MLQPKTITTDDKQMQIKCNFANWTIERAIPGHLSIGCMFDGEIRWVFLTPEEEEQLIRFLQK